jgi:hypothetical protein
MYVAWDSTSKVLLWVRESPPSAHVYTPATKSWEAVPLTADIAAARVGGRVLVYDPHQNVTVLFGGYTENPHMFLFRYGDGK